MSENSAVGLEGDSHRPNQGVWYREHLVLIVIISLVLLCGITTTTETVQMKSIKIPEVLAVYNLCTTVILMPALFLTAFVSDHIGRRPVIICMFVLSILSSTLQLISLKDMRLLVAFIVQGLFKSGTIVMSFIAIKDYCSPKYRLPCQIANAAVWQSTEFFTKSVFYERDVLGNDSVYMRALAIVLGLVCLWLTWMWPESPYWLASKRRLEESRKSFLWLRREESEDELTALLQTPSAPELPRLLKMSFLMTITTTTLYKISVWHQSNEPEFTGHKIKTALLLCISISAACLTGLIFHSIKRKMRFFAVATLPLVVYYIFDVSVPGEQRFVVKTNPSLLYVVDTACDYIRQIGPFLLGLTFISSICPLKYRSFLYALISYIQLTCSAMILVKLFLYI